jgi:phosphoglycerate dehydrogenase-like enzyme
MHVKNTHLIGGIRLMKRVLIYHSFPENYIDYLNNEYPDFGFTVCTDKNKVLDYLKDTEVLIAFRFNKKMLDASHNLKWVQVLSAGVDLLPLDDMKEKGIILTNGRGIHKIHMSEYAIASMINLARSFHTMFRNQLNGKWDRSMPQGEIYGSTLGIIGLGSIGNEIARRAYFLGMNVIGIKNTPGDVEFVDRVYGIDGIGEVFRQSDYIINLLPGTPDTEGIINTGCFDLMKSTACFINIGRGKTVNEADLIEALKNKKIRAAVLDVYNEEPLPAESPLWSLDNVILTPHICGESTKYLDKAMDIIKHNMDAYAYGRGSMINLVDYSKRY